MSSSQSHFLDKFCEIFELYSYGNIYYGRLCGHVLLGQALKTCRIYFGPIYIDPRISIFIVQPSGTGKSTPWGYIYQVAKQAGIKVEDIDEATDAALIGTIEQEEVIDPETRTKKTVYNKVTGKLATAEILHYDEGHMLIERKSYALNTLTWFQKALNPIGSEQNRCTKNLAHGTIDFYPSCSLIITSHPIKNLLESVLDTGFFQRIVLYPRDIPISERQGLEFLRADRLGKRVYTEPNIKELGEELQKIRAKYLKKEVVFDSQVKPIVKSKIRALYNLIKPAHPQVREIMATFIPRYNNFLYTFAFHHCCDRYGNVVKAQDINYAYGLVYVLFRELMSWVEETADFYKLGSKDYAYLRQASNIFHKMKKNPNGYVMRMKFMKVCAEKWKVSMPTVAKYLDKFKGYGKLKELEKGGVKYIKVEV